MFDPTKEVPSLELCKELKELGFPQDTGWYWVKTRIGWILGYLLEPQERYPNDYNFFFPIVEEICFINKNTPLYKAPTCRELGKWLPDFTASFKEETWWECHTNIWLEKDKKHYIEVADTEPNARAKMLIWLIKNKYITF